MQHDEQPPPAGEIALVPAPLDHPAVLRELWSCLGTDGRRALRRCCAAMREAVDAHAGCVEGQAESPVLSLDACARLVGTHTLTLRSMACLRGMLLGAVFPRLQSLRVHLVGETGKTHNAMRSRTMHPCMRSMRDAWPGLHPGWSCMAVWAAAMHQLGRVACAWQPHSMHA
jgi:hypothetical protein